MNVASVTLVQLPGIPYLTVLSLPLTPIDLKHFKNSFLSPRVLTFVSASSAEYSLVPQRYHSEEEVPARRSTG